MLPQFPIIPASKVTQDAAPRTPTDTLGSKTSDTATSPRGSENGCSPKDAPSLIALKRRSSLSQAIGRVRSASGSTMVSEDSKSARTVRKVKSLKSLINRPSSSSSSDSTLAKGQHHHDLAPWDRTVDVVYHQDPRGASGPDRPLDFERSVCLLLRENGRKRDPTKSYLALPAVVRFRILEYVVGTDPSHKPVGLTMARWNKDAWRPDEFLTLSEAMECLRPYLEVSFEFRANVLVYFLMTRHFHITYSLCVGPRLNPLATKWVEKYSPFMQSIALEIVLTEYRFGLNTHAHLLVPATAKLEKLIQNFVRAQLKRRSVTTLNSLVLLCRRFHGRRKVSSRPKSVEGSGGKLEKNLEAPIIFTDVKTDDYVYCPNGFLEICDPIKKLQGLVGSVRICGFNQPYTVSLIESLFSIPSTDKLKLHSYSVEPSTMWPQLEGQEAQVDAGDGRIKTKKFTGQSADRGDRRWGAVQLPAPAGDEPGADWMEKQMWLRRVTIRK